MRKKYLRGYILLLLVFLIYQIAVVPFAKNIVFWIAYFFSVFAIVMQAFMLREIMKSQALIKDRIYDFPVFRISILYLLVQVITGLILMGLSDKVPVFVAALTEMVILTVAVMGFYAAEAAQTEAVRQDAQQHREFAQMEELQTRVNLLIGQCEDGKTGEILHKLEEEIHYSNPLSKESTREIEEEITVLLSEIEAAALDADAEAVSSLCKRMTGLLRERDRICKHSR